MGLINPTVSPIPSRLVPHASPPFTFFAALIVGVAVLTAPTAASWAYPFWAQQNYEAPREATGKIVCANCPPGQEDHASRGSTVGAS